MRPSPGNKALRWKPDVIAKLSDRKKLPLDEVTRTFIQLTTERIFFGEAMVNEFNVHRGWVLHGELGELLITTRKTAGWPVENQHNRLYRSDLMEEVVSIFEVAEAVCNR